MKQTLVLGIGNVLLADEGVGVWALNQLLQQYAYLPDVRFLDGGTLSFTLAADIEESDHLLVLDAAQLGTGVLPGTVKTFEDVKMDAFLGAARRSVHEVGLIDLMDIARLTERVPSRRAIIGVQPEYLDWGDEPTEPLRKAMPQIDAEFRRILNDWGVWQDKVA